MAIWRPVALYLQERGDDVYSPTIAEHGLVWIADTVSVLNNGKLVDSGSVELVFDNPQSAYHQISGDYRMLLQPENP